MRHVGWGANPNVAMRVRGATLGFAPQPTWAFAAVLLLALANLAHADTTATDLRAAAEQAVRTQFGTTGSRVVIVPTRLNPRLHLAACAHALQTRIPVRQGIPSRVAVAVSCAGTPGWTIQVPVQMQVFRNVLVTSHPMARGDIPAPGDVHTEERDVARLGYGYIESLDQILGHSLGRPLIAGVVLEPGDFNGRETVHSGEEVELVAQLGGIEVRTHGMALDAGDTGARLRVRNDNSGRIINGVVIGEGQVQALP
ncbi:flagellar basal body P-ring biosynthesis protein FlgA [Dyella nitratireducens]|uniref:Flagella basal body P-ring formation protein FlgA n=2 Tax=Dyella nitratireducens TaxID=1849580 RepID=A0ABQ1FSJ4_9GAMM|nr:flagellar basal body P-ring biosynthesis protein FlgA [Dyella nitratireducens]